MKPSLYCPHRTAHIVLPTYTARTVLPQAALAKAFCNNRTEPGARLGPDFGNKQMFSHMTRIVAAGPDWVDFERPLHVDVNLQFKPSVLR